MPTVFINNLAVVLPSRFAAGQEIGENAAAVLNEIQHQRVRVRLRRLVQRGELAEEEIQPKADAFMAEELEPYGVGDEDIENDPVFKEALGMARELIVGRMAAEGLPPPKGIDNHAKALVEGMPALMEKARLRVEARYRAAAAAIGQLA